MQFFILDINGTPPPAELAGFNDVVMVPAGNGVVRFIAQFNDHSNNTIPYMYHCHMLTHEDMGMMGQFLVVDPSSGILELGQEEKELVKIVDFMGREVIPTANSPFIYIYSDGTVVKKVIIE